MTNPSLADCYGGVENDLTPLGERRPKLPLQRKVKQLERPWKVADKRQAAGPHVATWASSQQGSADFPCVGVRPRSGASACRNRGGNKGSSRRMRNSASTSSGLSAGRRRPSTEPSSSSSGLRRQRTWGNGPPSHLPLDPMCNGLDRVRWDGTGTKTRGPLNKPEQAHIAAVHGYGYRPGSPSVAGNGHMGLVGNNQRVQAEVTSVISSRSFFATSSITTSGAAEDVGGEGVDPIHEAGRLINPPPAKISVNNNNNNNEEEEDSYNNKSNVSLGSMEGVGLSDVGGGVAVNRPNSAGVSTARGSSIHPLGLKGDKIVRPRTADSSSQGRAVYPRSASGESRSSERGRTSTSSRPGPEKGGSSVTSWTDESPDTGSLLECRPSVSVVLPTLEEGNDTGDKRFSSGSAQEIPSRGESEAGTAPPGHAESLVVDTGGVQSNNLDAHAQASWKRSDMNSQQRTFLGTPAPPISALGYFVGDSRPSGAALHGRALVANHHPRPSASKRSLPFPPAVTPGEQPYGDTHPLSPTSMGSPPRRHRNSNWGEEGVRLAAEEKENSRQTVPFIVSGTLLGWKLSTRERKKSLEDSLKNSDYSEHHLIPVYGFRRGNEDAREGEGDGGEGTNGGGGGANVTEERRMELRRLEARALAAERMSLERRSRAEGGPEGAAFARAMCRRATARAEWIQKMGDVHDVRKENVFRGSSPEELSAYRKRVRDRLHDERVRRRTARGLPSRRPPCISAVTSRADFPSACRRDNNPTTTGNNGGGKRACGDERDGPGGYDGDGLMQDELGLIQDELGREPYLMLVRAKNKSGQEEEATHGGGSAGAVVGTRVHFCSECLGCCQGACSHGGIHVGRKGHRRHVTKPKHQWRQSTTGKMQQQQVGGLW